jgi:hypothetical protein
LFFGVGFALLLPSGSFVNSQQTRKTDSMDKFRLLVAVPVLCLTPMLGWAAPADDTTDASQCLSAEGSGVHAKVLRGNSHCTLDNPFQLPTFGSYAGNSGRSSPEQLHTSQGNLDQSRGSFGASSWGNTGSSGAGASGGNDSGFSVGSPKNTGSPGSNGSPWSNNPPGHDSQGGGPPGWSSGPVGGGDAGDHDHDGGAQDHDGGKPPVSVPEPGLMGLFLLGFTGLMVSVLPRRRVTAARHP